MASAPTSVLQPYVYYSIYAELRIQDGWDLFNDKKLEWDQ